MSKSPNFRLMDTKLKLDQLNTVDTSVEIWMEFCTESMQTDFYKLALEKTGDMERAAALTLLRNYISIFSPQERARIETDAEFFYGYAKGFIEELAPFRYNRAGYDKQVRRLFLSRIRSLLKAQKKPDGTYVDKDRYVFIETIVRICSSLDYIIRVHDDYKEFLYREMPQFRTSPVSTH